MKRKRLLPKTHTGKIAHHRHTAYGWLVVVLLLAFIPLFIMSHGVASADATDPVAGQQAVYAVVPGPVPQTAPTITSPSQNASYQVENPVNVAGGCPDTTLVKVFKNNVLAGAVFCENGHYSVPIDLFLGTNTLIARAYNSNNIAGPESLPTTVTGNASVAAANPNITLSDQFFVTSDILYKGINVDEQLEWPLIISGGQAPYAISVGWGDGKTDLISQGQAGTISIKHIYESAGKGYHNSYNVTVQATDQAGRKAFIQLVSIVSGNQPSVIGSIKSGYNWSTTLRLAWQLMLAAGVMVFSFWLGERREAFMFKRKFGKT